MEASNHWSEASEQFEAAAKIDDRFAELQFRLGQCLLNAGRPAQARGRFELARDLDALRFRADTRINATIREVARRQENDGVRLVDADGVLAASLGGADSIPGQEFFYEHVHMRFEANYFLACGLLDQLSATMPQLAFVEKRGGIPTRQQCAELLARTPWDEYRSADEMLRLTCRPPFTNQLGHSKREGSARKTRDDLLALASTPTARQAAWQTYEAAVAKAPHDGELRNNFGLLAMQAGRFDVAVEQFRIAAAKKPEAAMIYASLCNALAAQGQAEEAFVLFRKVLELKPDDPEAHNSFGAALLRRGRVDEAITHFQKALEIKPDYTQARENLVSVLANRGRVQQLVE
jgi:Tfp pilus assembly protein PilF